MKKLLIFSLALALVLGLAMTAGAASFFDNFNRPDSSDLGPNWTTSGIIGISGNMAASTIQDAYYATVNGFSQNYLTTTLAVDALSTSSNLNYVGLILGYADANHNLFVKVQDQDSGATYDHVAFYYGNNSPVGDFFSITPFATGRITAYAIDPFTIQLDIDSDFDGIADYSYTNSTPFSAAQIAGLGTGIGLGMWGEALADNYAANHPIPLPGAVWLLGSGLLGLTGWRKFRKK